MTVMSTKPINLILIGPQGAGKGTQAEKLIQRYHFYSLETGRLFRQLAQQPTELGQKIKQRIDHGMLVELDIFRQAVQSELDKIPPEQGIIFDGLPRSLEQADMLDQLLPQYSRQIDGVIYLKLDRQTSIERLSQRRICPKCGKVYSLALQPDLTTCQCGGQLVQRHDDTPQAIAKRLEVFEQQTLPLLRHYADKVITVDASASIEQVFEEVCQAVDQIIAKQNND